ncbi:sensor histidine kinase [Flaviaesturariibacter amylovorans]|uniref:Signal transduction histidine kinase internal region domain-containing protein n=1 Tax=Flaviaesturariibacter amylovorans TaxID=1084520 RepID=A0ABP8GMU5_9BACT
MEAYPFIFANDRRTRLQRHLLFWFTWWAFQSFLYSFAAGLNMAAYGQRLPVAALESALFLVPHLFLAYTLMYGVIPQQLLKGRYVQAALTVPFIFLATGVIASTMGMYVILPLRIAVFGPVPRFTHANEVHFFLGLLAGLRGAITIGGLAAAIRLMKLWYLKEQRNGQLQRENMAAQLQLLTAQVHPHFLFNTLNNIFAQAQPTAPKAAHLVTGLSDLLRYMLYEGSKPEVPLHRELALLRDYFLLEQERYGNALELSIDLPEETGDLAIAPLLLLPYVENCFKHGASHLLEQPWISLQVALEGDWMRLKLLNAKPPEAVHRGNGIGMNNVAKRLQLLYPGQHHLEITDGEDVFIVNLKLRLRRCAEPAPKTTFHAPQPA